MASICFSFPGSKTSPILLELSLISGFHIDFHRKSLDIVKLNPNNAEIHRCHFSYRTPYQPETPVSARGPKAYSLILHISYQQSALPRQFEIALAVLLFTKPS